MTKEISMAEVRQHNSRENGVWMVIHDDVYDVTKFLEEHPGGEETLLDVAGKEATREFEDVGHSEDARTILKKYKIGTMPENDRRSNNREACGCCPPCPSKGSLSARGGSNKSLHDKKQRRTDEGPSIARVPSRLTAKCERESKPESIYEPTRSQGNVESPVPRRRSSSMPRSRRNLPCEDDGSRWIKLALLVLVGSIIAGCAYRKFSQ